MPPLKSWTWEPEPGSKRLPSERVSTSGEAAPLIAAVNTERLSRHCRSWQFLTQAQSAPIQAAVAGQAYSAPSGAV